MDMKTIILTGCTRGLGLEMLKGFVASGHTVLGTARSAKKVSEFSHDYGAPHHFETVDMADNQAVTSWATQCIQKYGAPDIVINNAALINENIPFWDIPSAEFDEIIDVNIKGVANVCRAFLPSMREANKGVLVNFSSGYGHVTAPGVTAYCATKFAIEGLTQAIAKELPSGMAAVPFNPGIIHTEMLEKTFGRELASQHEKPQAWAQRAVPSILSLGPKHNGQSIQP